MESCDGLALRWNGPESTRLWSDEQCFCVCYRSKSEKQTFVTFGANVCILTTKHEPYLWSNNTKKPRSLPSPCQPNINNNSEMKATPRLATPVKLWTKHTSVSSVRGNSKLRLVTPRSGQQHWLTDSYHPTLHLATQLAWKVSTLPFNSNSCHTKS